MFCACGNEIKDGTQFCQKCKKEVLPPPTTAPVSVTPPPGMHPMPEIEDTRSSRDLPLQQQALPYQAQNQPEQHHPQQHQLTDQTQQYQQLDQTQSHPPRTEQHQSPQQNYSPQQYQQQYAPQYHQPPQTQQILPHPYQTLGGFLLVLAIIILINVASSFFTSITELPSDIALIQNLIGAGFPVPGILYALSMVMLILQTIFELLLVLAIFARNRHLITVSVVGAIAGLSGIVCLAASYALTPGMSASDADFLIAVSVGSGIISIIIAVLIVVYLLRSVRVRTYMRSDDYITKGLWKFVKPPVPAAPHMTRP